jgi:hypothetical protein
MMPFENVLLDNDLPNVEEISVVLRQGYNPKRNGEYLK